jgi:DegV family protein with EDD domain
MVEAAGIEVLPFPYTLDGVEHLDDFGRTMPFEEFYAALDNGAVAKTSQIPLASYLEAFGRAFDQGKSALLISLSSTLSGTHGASLLARDTFLEENPGADIHCIDSLCASGGEGLLVLEAARRLADGGTAGDVARWLDANKSRVNHYFTVDSFQHLVRGGRVSPAVGMAGGLLNIKPVLHMDGDGRLTLLKTPRGRRRAIEMLADLAAANIEEPAGQTVIVSHGDCADDAAVLERLLAEKAGVTSIVRTRIGVIIGTHTGGGVLSVYFWGKRRTRGAP